LTFATKQDVELTWFEAHRIILFLEDLKSLIKLI